jgi:tetratricopeptide (TPR) repeat protein
VSCSEKVRIDFNLATALLHSFEYSEAEKVFAKIIDTDPQCIMAYWGVAMSNFHPLWAPPTKDELTKGSAAIALARSLESKAERETDYVEAAAALYDDWENKDHHTRLMAFENAAEKIYRKYPGDKEASIFYSLALRAAADPTDKTFSRQRKAGQILNALFTSEPDHPGIAHYLIHSFDYPELAELALPAARKYATIAATSAHALHMPSHIFTRLGLWNESIQSNINSIAAAKCYAENSGIKGHWDEELHGIDYLVYAYLQQGRDDMANEQAVYLQSIDAVFPVNNKNAYTFAAVPSRCALEKRNWEAAAMLKLHPDFPWNDFPWEKSIVSFTRLLGSVHLNRVEGAKQNLAELKANYAMLTAKSKAYEANQVQIQIKASEAWLNFSQGNKEDAIKLMTEAADMEDATEKHPVTPGEVIPARELLGDLFMELGEFERALEAYEADLERHPGRYNGLYGAGLAAKNCGKTDKAILYFKQLMNTAGLSEKQRPELETIELFLKTHS